MASQSPIGITIGPLFRTNGDRLFIPSRVIGQVPGDDRLVDVGGYRLHLKCMGAGSPTVVIEAGLGGSSDGWIKVMPEVAKFTRVCG